MYVPPGFAVVTPYLTAPDGEAYVRFLIAAFGAREIGRSTRPDGAIANCQLDMGGAAIMVSQSPAHKAGAAALYFYVEDADAAMARAVAAGATPILAVDDMPYGDRQGGVEDPAGTVWWISQRLIERPYF